MTATPNIAAELWLVDQLRQYGGARIFAGAHDPAVRRERMRKIILDNHLADVPVTLRDGERISFAQHFQSIYGVELDAQTPPTRE